MAPDPPTPVAAEIAQERPHVLEQWWPEPLGVVGWRLRRKRRQWPAATGRWRTLGQGGGGPGGPFGGRPGGPGPLPDLDALIGRLQAYIRSLLGGGRGSRGRFTGGRGLALIGLAVVALWLASGIYRVEPDEQGVVLRFGAFDRTTLPGLNYHMPWPIEQALTPAVTRINRIEIGYRTQRRRSTPATRAGATCWKRA